MITLHQQPHVSKCDGEKPHGYQPFPLPVFHVEIGKRKVGSLIRRSNWRGASSSVACSSSGCPGEDVAKSLEHADLIMPALADLFLQPVSTRFGILAR